MKIKWFLFFLGRSLSQRKGRLLIASASVTLAVSVITAMAAVSFGIRGKLGGEMKSYGANIIVSQPSGGYLGSEAVKAISGLRHAEDVTGQVYGRGISNGKDIEIIGLEPDSLKGRGWRFTGSLPQKRGELLAGTNLRDALKLTLGQTITVSSENRIEFVVSGFFEKGGAEDSALILSIPDAWDLLGLSGKLSVVLLRGESGRLESVAAGIREILPDASVKTLRQVALPEESMLGKIQLLMVLVTAVVLLPAIVSVAGTIGANVFERREEIGLMKALGADKSGIAVFYFAESAIIGFTGGTAGFLLGCLSAEAVSKGAFNSLIGIPLYLPVSAIAMGLIIAVASGHFPVRETIRHNAAVLLRGE